MYQDSPGAASCASRSQTAESSLLGWPVYPVDGIWEYWIYTSVGGGIELTFVQRNYPGPYEYADIPLGTGKIAGIWQRMNPQMVLRREVTKTPSTYRPDFATGPLDFSFYTAGFRADDGQTVLEIYYGIPTRDLAFRTGEGGTMADLSRGTAVYGEGGDPVARVSEEVTVRSAGTAADTSAGSFVPEMDRIVLPPGDYRLAVQVMDRGTGRTQVYRQDRSLKDFTGDQLAVSDVELAARVSLVPEAQSRGRGRFVKGDVEVIPMASRTFAADQPVFIYYEIYNLARDEFGATRYRISYEIRSLERKSVAARVLGGLGKMLSLDDQDGVIRIEYEQLGEQAWENAFLELDMANSEPGIQLLKIRVTDTVSGQVARASATFTTR